MVTVVEVVLNLANIETELPCKHHIGVNVLINVCND